MSLDKDKDPNLLFNMRLDGGETPLRVLLSKKYKELGQSQESKQRDTSKSVGRIRRPADELVPRIKRGVTIYDMGMWSDGMGGYSRIDHYFVPPSDHDIDIDAGGLEVAKEPISGTFMSDLSSLVLSVPTSQFKSTFRQIRSGTYEAQNTIFQYTDDTLGTITTDLFGSAKFVHDKWMLSNAEANSIVFYMVNVMTDMNWDIATLTPNPLDPDVSGSMVVGNDAEIYLMPQFIQQFGQPVYDDGTFSTPAGGGTRVVTDYSSVGVFALDRNYLSQYGTWIFMSAGYAKDWYGLQSVIRPNAGSHSFNMRYSLERFPTSPYHNAKLYSEPSDASSPPSTYFNSGGLITVDATHKGLSLNNTFGFWSIGTQGLKGIIKTGGHYYYLWNNTGVIK